MPTPKGSRAAARAPSLRQPTPFGGPGRIFSAFITPSCARSRHGLISPRHAPRNRRRKSRPHRETHRRPPESLPRCPLRTDTLDPARTARRHHPLRPMHRQARQHRHRNRSSGNIAPPPTTPHADPADARTGDPIHRLLPQQGAEHPSLLPARSSTSTTARSPAPWTQLTALAGVGRKTANVVLGNAFGINVGVVVDTHVARLSQRLGLSAEKNPEEIEDRPDAARRPGPMDPVQSPVDLARPPPVRRPETGLCPL